MNNILISVVTTVRNGEKYLLETIESVYNQTYKHYEHIIVDDGSADGTLEIIEQFCNYHADHKIHLFKTKGIGRGQVLNLGVSQTNGEWIAIIDADDLWHPQKLEKQSNVIFAMPGDVFGTNAELFSLQKDISFNKYVAPLLCIISKRSFFFSNQVSHSSVVIKKEICSYDAARKSQFDYALWLKLTAEGKIFYNDNNVLTYHRIHEGQSFESKQKKLYSWRSFTLKTRYALKSFNFVAVIYNIIKLVFDLLTPRRFRLKVRKLIK